MHKLKTEELEALSEKIRSACIQASREGYQDASLSGLCREGAMEAAVGAMQSLNIEKIISDFLEK